MYFLEILLFYLIFLAAEKKASDATSALAAKLDVTAASLDNTIKSEYLIITR